MLLAIDIGNTNIVIGIFDKSRLFGTWRLSTLAQRTVDEYYLTLSDLFNTNKIILSEIEGLIIASVTPKPLNNLRCALSKLLDLVPLVLGENIIVPIKNLYDDPSQVGQDRLVNALSVYRIYGGHSIVVDFGTAITFDLVSRQGEYLGGIIVPGIEISLEALTNRAALLPSIELSEPKSLLCKDTVNSMKSGIIYGFSALCDGVVSKLKEEFGKDLQVIATGGQAELIVTHCKTIDKVDPYLTLKGLRIIYNIGTSVSHQT